MLDWTFKQWMSSHLILASVLGLVMLVFLGVSVGSLRVTFLDVGQGDAILIQTPVHKTILIDAGLDGEVVDELGAAMGFFDKTIDLFVLSHPDRDHYGGILDVMSKYRIKQILLTGVVSKDPVYLEFLRRAQNQDIDLIYASSDMDWDIGGGVYLDVLYPFENQSLLGQKVGNKNNTSIALRVMRAKEGGGLEPLVMLSGDGEAEQERELVLSGQALSSNVLKLGHHGSRSSTIPSFLAAVEPKEVVVSAGANNSFGHPHAEVMERVQDLGVHETRRGPVTFEF